MKPTKKQENKKGRRYANERMTAVITSDGDCVPAFSNEHLDDNDPWSKNRSELVKSAESWNTGKAYKEGIKFKKDNEG